MHNELAVTLAEPNAWIEYGAFAFIALGWILNFLLEGENDSYTGLTESSGKHKEGEQ